jgi:hypothetical protein
MGTVFQAFQIGTIVVKMAHNRAILLLVFNV